MWTPSEGFRIRVSDTSRVRQKHLLNLINTGTMSTERLTRVQAALYNAEQSWHSWWSSPRAMWTSSIQSLCWHVSPPPAYLSPLRCKHTSTVTVSCFASSGRCHKTRVFSLSLKRGVYFVHIFDLKYEVTSSKSAMHQTDSCWKAIDVAQAEVTTHLRTGPQICCSFKGHVYLL